MSGPPVATADLRLPVAVGVGMAALYVATAARSVQGHDSGELIAAAHSFGVPHPPGFPSFTVFAGLWVRVLPFGSATDLALLSAVCGGIACGLACALARRLGARAAPATAAAIVFGLIPSTWHVHTGQEVQGALPAAALAIAWLSARTIGVRSGVVLGAACGVAAGVHPAVVFAAPLVVLALGLPVDGPRRARWVGCLAAVPLGLATHLYLPWAWAGTGTPRWGQLDSVGAVAAHALRDDYGTLDLALGGTGPAGAGVLRLWTEWAVGGVGLAIVGLVVGAVLGLRARQRIAAGLVLSTLMAGVLFPLGFNVPDSAGWHAITARFHPLAFAFGAPLVALGVDRLAARLPPRTVAPALGGWILAAGVLGLARGPSVGRDLPRAWADDVLATARTGALIVTGSDTGYGALLDAQVARDLRPDVDVVVAALLPAPWYAADVARRTGYAHPPGRAGVRLLIEHAHATGRPIYFTGGLPRVLRAEFVEAPARVLVEVLPPGATLPRPGRLEEDLEAFFSDRAHALRLPPWAAAHPHERVILQRYRAPWLALAGVYGRLGRHAAAARAAERAAWLDAQF